MGNLANIDPNWAEDISQIEPGEDVEGGPSGVDNQPHRQLASRTAYLKALVEGIITSLADFAAKVHGHVMTDITGLVDALAGKAPSDHGHTIPDVTDLQTALDACHKKTGTESHVGRFLVSAEPVSDLDVLRKKDVKNRSVVPYANAAQFAQVTPYVQYPYGANNTPMKLNQIQMSGVNVEALSGGGWKAKQKGLYKVDLWVSNHGSPPVADYIKATLAVKTALNPSAGFATVLFTDQNFYGDGKSEATVGGHIVVELCKDDVLGLFFSSGSVSWMLFDVVIQYLGERAPTDVLGIVTGDWTGMAANGQQYPKIVVTTLRAANASGSVEWDITGGTAESFASISDGELTVEFPSTGAWTLILQAEDAAGNIANKTINLTLSAYQQVQLVVTAVDGRFTAVSYPYAPNLQLSSTGGESPITWSVVAGGDTTLPSAAITNGNQLTGSVANAGSWTAKVRATDSAGSPQTADKVLTVTVADYTAPGGGGGVCFEASSTYVLMGNGTGRLIQDVLPGDRVMGVPEANHLAGRRSAAPTLVTDKMQRAGDQETSVLVKGIKSTPGHAWGTVQGTEGAWTRARELDQASMLVQLVDGIGQPCEASECTTSSGVQECANLGTQAGTFFVGATEHGPWFMVHNYNYEERPDNWC